MNAQEFRTIGPRIFGEGWQREVSILWDINERTVRNWVSGKMPIPEAIAADLRGMEAVMMVKPLTLLRLIGGQFVHQQSGLIFEVRPVGGLRQSAGTSRPSGRVSTSAG